MIFFFSAHIFLFRSHSLFTVSRPFVQASTWENIRPCTAWPVSTWPRLRPRQRELRSSWRRTDSLETWPESHSKIPTPALHDFSRNGENSTRFTANTWAEIRIPVFRLPSSKYSSAESKWNIHLVMFSWLTWTSREIRRLRLLVC